MLGPLDLLPGVRHLSNDRMSLVVDLGFGARVRELRDHGTGRQWLLQGPPVRDVSDTVSYRGDASRGWDECFPTILPCTNADWGGPLRDHGMLWGRPWTLQDAGPSHLTASYIGAGFEFSRSLHLDGPLLTARYAVTSHHDAPLPYLWSQHCVLAVRPRDQITVTGTGRMSSGEDGFEWPHHPRRDLTQVGSHDEGFVVKCYAHTAAKGMAQVSGPNGGIRFDWTAPDVPALGLWLDYGGWPEEGPLHQVAIEPTTACADDLAAALSQGEARWLKPGETHRWLVRLTLLYPVEGSAP